jgi:hypothetical protein
MLMPHAAAAAAVAAAVLLLIAATVLGAETWPLGVALSGQLCRLVLHGAGLLSDLSTAALLGPYNWSKLTHLDIQGAKVRTLCVTVKTDALLGAVPCLQVWCRTPCFRFVNDPAVLHVCLCCCCLRGLRS